MTMPFDPFWIASQLQLSLGQLIAVPFGVIAILWLAARMSQKTEAGNYVAVSKTGQVIRFGLGFGGGLAVLFLANVLVQLLIAQLSSV